MTNSNGWKCRIFQCYSFNVCDHIVLVVADCGQANSLNSESYRDENKKCPAHFEQVAFCGHNLSNTWYRNRFKIFNGSGFYF